MTAINILLLVCGAMMFVNIIVANSMGEKVKTVYLPERRTIRVRKNMGEK